MAPAAILPPARLCEAALPNPQALCMYTYVDVAAIVAAARAPARRRRATRLACAHACACAAPPGRAVYWYLCTSARVVRFRADVGCRLKHNQFSLPPVSDCPVDERPNEACDKWDMDGQPQGTEPDGCAASPPTSSVGLGSWLVGHDGRKSSWSPGWKCKSTHTPHNRRRDRRREEFLTLFATRRY